VRLILLPNISAKKSKV